MELIVGMMLAHSEEASQLRLEGAVDVGEASHLKDLLLDSLTAGKKICVDLAHATYLDITCIQLLYALERETQRGGLELELLAGPAEDVARGLNDAGMERLWFARPADSGTQA